MFKMVLKVKQNASMPSIPSTLFSYNLNMCMFNSATGVQLSSGLFCEIYPIFHINEKI